MKKYIRICPNIKRNARTYKSTRQSFRKDVWLGVSSAIALGGAMTYLVYNRRRTIEPKEVAHYINMVTPDKENTFVYLFKYYVKEPIMILCRFSFICINLFPIIITIPIYFTGFRLPDKDNERSGALVWYIILCSRLQNGGPTFIKLAQWAASRSDIFPKHFCVTLSNLHSNNTAHSLEFTEKLIRNCYGLSIEEMFIEFEPIPIGVGAIAQVYKAKLRVGVEAMVSNIKENKESNCESDYLLQPYNFNDNYIAVKVLHPNVENIIRRDLVIMKFVAHLLDLIPTFHWLSLPGEVYTFGKMMKSQLDLREEGYNLLQFHMNFAQDSRVDFPIPHLSLLRKDILIETYELAIPINVVLHSNIETVFDKKFANIGLDSFLNMIIYDNFIHSDLHPGNIMIKFYYPTIQTLWNKNKDPSCSNELINEILDIKDQDQFLKALDCLDDMGYLPRLIYLDAGLVTTLNGSNRRNLLDLFRAIAEFDGYKAGKLMIERSRINTDVVEPEEFAAKMKELIVDVKDRTFSLKNVRLSHLLGQIMDMTKQHHVKLESDFVNVVISILILEGIGRKLDKDLDLFNTALPILRNFGTYDAPRYAFKNANIADSKNGIWWLKLWFQLEARQWLANALKNYDDKDIRRFIEVYAFNFLAM